jgi:hypothetical protein
LAADPLEQWVAKIEHRARQILLDAGHDPDKPGLLPEPLEQGGLLNDSHILLRHLNIFKSEVICDANAAVRRAIK